MGFGAPLFLAGLGLLALPLWLHLLKRHRATPERFSSLMFFERSLSTSVRQRKFDYIKLLIARLALLALAVFAFTRPYLSSAAGGAGDDSGLTIIAIDESASMAAFGAASQAREEALALASTLPAAVRIRVLAFAAGSRLLNEPTASRDEVRAAIGSIQPTGARSSLGDLAVSLRNIARAAGEPITVHLFSDLQRTSMPPSFSELRLDPGTRLVVHQTTGGEKANWSVESVTAPSRITEPSKARVEAIIAAYHTDQAEKTVELRAAGRVLSTKTLTVPASGKARVEFEGLDPAYGYTRYEVALTAADALAADNAYSFAALRADPDTVLLLGSPATTTAAARFVTTALDAVSPGLFRVDGATPGAQLPPATAVILSGVGALPSTTENALRRFVEQGGGIFISLGAADAESGRVPLVGAKVLSSNYAARSGTRFQSVGWADPSHPSLEGTSGLAGSRFYLSYDIDPGAGRIVARLGNGLPLLVEYKLGEGRVLVFTSGLDGLSNDLPLQPDFLPFIDRSLKWLAGAGERVHSSKVGDSFELRAAGASASNIEVERPSGARALSLAEAAKATAVRLDEPGFWTIRKPGARSEVVAVNVDRRESNLETMPRESAELWQGAEASEGASGAPRAEEPAKTQIWPFLLTLACAAAILESLIALNHLSREAA